jgi:hypothetical protein
MLWLRSNAFSANEKGNGGDICESRIIDIRNDIKKWIEKGGSQQLHLPPNLTLAEYNAKMLTAIKHTTVSCTDSHLSIGDSDKTCINYSLKENNTFMMKCNFARFQNTDESNQYKLVHHELAGVAGFEVNDGKDESKYDTSGQITKYLKNTVIKKLVITSSQKLSSESEINPKEVLQFVTLGKYFLRQDDIEMRLDFYEQNKSMLKEKIRDYVEIELIPQLLTLKSEYSATENESSNSNSRRIYKEIQIVIDSKIDQIKKEMEATISQVDLTSYEQRLIHLFLAKKAIWEKKLVLAEEDDSLFSIVRESEYRDISQYDEENSINFLYQLDKLKERINRLFTYKENTNYLLFKFEKQLLLATDIGGLLEIPEDCLKSGGWGSSQYNFLLPFSSIKQVKLLVGVKGQGPITMRCSRGFNTSFEYNAEKRKFNINYTKETWGSLFDSNVAYHYPKPKEIFEAIEKN